ncbi:SMI1/KNR4 family protein [Streptomyces lavendulae]|uniref:SMI1/KNR4 family protein n=1 Tax=Streptomyces lavendulae TaxID=1914 RepID=UPI0036C6C541
MTDTRNPQGRPSPLGPPGAGIEFAAAPAAGDGAVAPISRSSVIARAKTWVTAGNTLLLHNPANSEAARTARRADGYRPDMTQGFEFAASLTGGVEDRRGAWSFIQGFAAHWAGALETGDGWAETDLAAAEERLGLRLPAALREAYLLFGRRGDLTSNHDVLLSPSELYVDDAKEALVFRHENQGTASWGILLDSLQDDDPAVFIRPDLADKSAERWEAWLERLSLCFVEILLSESVQADHELCDFLDPDDDSIELLEENTVRLPFPAYPMGEEEQPIRWFLGRDALLREDGMAVLARGRTAEDLDRVRDLIPGDWLNDHR